MTRILTVTFALAATVATHAQSPSGTWVSTSPQGVSVTLDLNVRGTSVSGAMIVAAPDQTVKTAIQKGTVVGATLSFLLLTDREPRAFVGEFAGDALRLRPA